MKVKRLIEKLKKHDQEKEVAILFNDQENETFILSRIQSVGVTSKDKPVFILAIKGF